MSFNIDRWITKEMTDFKIPIDVLTQHFDVVTNEKTGVTWASIGEGGIGGVRKGEFFFPAKFRIFGVSSGRDFIIFADRVLPYSKGRFVASLVWEGGESIQRLTVVDGEVTLKEIEI